MMIPRFLAKSVEQALKRQAAVAIIGPRQVGKTTLAREIANSHPGALYLDLEAREDREKLVSYPSAAYGHLLRAGSEGECAVL